MTTPMPLCACSSDPAVIVASSNSGLRKQIVQDLMLSRISGGRGNGWRRRFGQAGEQRVPIVAARSAAARPGCRRICCRSSIGSFRALMFFLLDESGIPAVPSQWRSASACHLFETSQSLAGPAPVILDADPPDDSGAVAGNGRARALHGSGLSHGAAGGSRATLRC